ncbi:MAG: phosphopyruvate hydratase, partial [Candidatus Micrarchaeota archaeon]
RMSSETYHTLKGLLKKKFGARATLIGDEGGFVPPINTLEERLELMLKAAEEAGYKNEMKPALDCASSEFYDEASKTYTIVDKKYTSAELVDFYAEAVKKYGIISIEDGMSQNDWEGWALMTSKLGIQIIGDDLLCTNPKLIKKAIEQKAVNSLLLKVNQIGSVSESLDAAKLSFNSNWTVVVSHRSGETEDPFIADLVVAIAAGQSKFGAPARSDRNAKYNQLLRIEEELGSNAVYPGVNFREISR